MTCCTNDSSLIVGSTGSLSFQLGINGKAYPFDDATLVTARLVDTGYTSTTGGVITCTDTADADWRSGFGVVDFDASATSSMQPGMYRLEIKTDQPVIGLRIWRTNQTISVLGSP